METEPLTMECRVKMTILHGRLMFPHFFQKAQIYVLDYLSKDVCIEKYPGRTETMCPFSAKVGPVCLQPV